MKKFLIVLVALLFSVSVQAADITWSVTTSGGTVDLVKTVSDANMDRFIAWVCGVYEIIDDGGTPNDPSDDTIVPCDTNGQKAQHVNLWLASQWQGTKANVLRWERNLAATTAEAGVPDIPD